MKNFTEFLAHVAEIEAAAPKLSATEQIEYERIRKRLLRAETDQRRAKTRDDTKKLAAAERAFARASKARDTLVAPYVSPLWAPARIIAKRKFPWGSGQGLHVQECEMVLDHKDLSGPYYRTVRVLKDEGGPPTNARSPFFAKGIAWHAINYQIESGDIVVLSNEEPS